MTTFSKGEIWLSAFKSGTRICWKLKPAYAEFYAIIFCAWRLYWNHLNLSFVLTSALLCAEVNALFLHKRPIGLYGSSFFCVALMYAPRTSLANLWSSWVWFIHMARSRHSGTAVNTLKRTMWHDKFCNSEYVNIPKRTICKKLSCVVRVLVSMHYRRINQVI